MDQLIKFNRPYTSSRAPQLILEALGEEHQQGSGRFGKLAEEEISKHTKAKTTILTPSCTPTFIAKNHPNIFIENPSQGGHCGFMLPNQEFAWSEIRALEFTSEVL